MNTLDALIVRGLWGEISAQGDVDACSIPVSHIWEMQMLQKHDLGETERWALVLLLPVHVQ